MTKLTSYLSEKIEATKRHKEFKYDPIAEEALQLLTQLVDTQLENLSLKEQLMIRGFDVDAEKRNVEYLKQKLVNA